MSMTLHRRIKNILKKQEAIDSKAVQISKEIDELLPEALIYAAFMHRAYLNGTGEIDAAEMAEFQTRIEYLTVLSKRLSAALESMSLLKGVDDNQTRTNLDAFIAANGLDVARYSAEFSITKYDEEQ